VEEFVNLHQDMRDKWQQRRLMSKQFTAYLVTRCYEKMRRRVGHWSSEGFIYYLGQVKVENLRNAVAQTDDMYTYMGWCNLDLCKAVAENLDQIQDHIINHCPSTYAVPQLTHLVSGCKRIVADSQEPPQSNLYNESTCVEFHQLLVATLLAYGKALNELYDSRQKKAPVAGLVPLAQRIWYCASMLWRLAYSGILNHHLEVLDTNEWLRVPMYRQQHITNYQQFTVFSHQDETSHSAMEEVDDEDEEFECMTESSAIVNIAKTFRTWLHLLVSHWEALSVLSHNAARPNSSIRITFLAMQSHTGSYNVTEWELTIKRLVQDCCPLLTNSEPIDAATVIKYLWSQIATALQAQHCHSIFHRFRNSNLSWRGILHCDAALVSLVEFVDNLSAGCMPIQRVIKVMPQLRSHDINF